MPKKSTRLRTTAARVIRAGREQSGELRTTLFAIAAEYKKQAHEAEVRRGESPRSKKSRSRVARARVCVIEFRCRIAAQYWRRSKVAGKCAGHICGWRIVTTFACIALEPTRKSATP
jgi:hypothetical protein